MFAAMRFQMLQIMNAALVSQGQYEIVANDGSDEFRVLSRNWPLIVEAELEDGAYHFAKQQAELVTRQDGKYDFTDSYLVPGDALHVRDLWTIENDVAIVPEWVQDGTAVYVDGDSGVIIEYVTSADPAVWSANFARGIQMRLEAVICRSMKEEVGAALKLEEAAELYFQRARTNSAKAKTASEPFWSGRLAQARFSRG